VPLLTAAAEPIRLQPSSQWVIDYADNSCRLIRTFGAGKDETKLVIESAGPGAMSMLITGAPVRVSIGDTVTARFVPLQIGRMEGNGVLTERGQNAAVWPNIAFAAAVKFEELPPAEQEEAKAARKRSAAGLRPLPISIQKRTEARAKRLQFAEKSTAIQLEARRATPVVLETGSLGEPIRMFDECERDLLRSWGVDPAVEDRIVLDAWARNASRWFSVNDYPPQMLAQNAESIIMARLLIDATGKITKCTSLSHFNAPQFQKAVCDAFMRRGRFAPAELEDGTKVPTYGVQTVIFRQYG